MNKLICLLLVIAALYSCTKEETEEEACSYPELPGIANSTNTIIPIHSENFWIYADSLWDNGVFQRVESTLLNIDKVYELDGKKAVKFSSLLSVLLIKGDTLFSTELTPSPSAPNCYEIYYPKFFNTQDSLVVQEGLVDKVLYKSSAPVNTPVGTYSDNIIFSEGDYFRIVCNPQVGIVKISFFVDKGSGLEKGRTLTLKDFKLN